MKKGSSVANIRVSIREVSVVASEAVAKAAAKSAEAQTSLWLLPSVEMEQQQSTLFCSWVVEMQLKQESHGFERF